MSRWQPDARGRLERAAFELFVQQGYAETTVPEIAQRAGLTNRTFFRYFHDKAEVLFAAGDEFPDRVAEIMSKVPHSSSIWAILEGAFAEIGGSLFRGQHDYFHQRREIIRSDETLQERDLAKQSDLLHAVAAGFRSLGYPDLTALAAAHTCVSILSIARDRWLDDADARLFEDYVADAVSAVRSITDIRDDGSEQRNASKEEQGRAFASTKD